MVGGCQQVLIYKALILSTVIEIPLLFALRFIGNHYHPQRLPSSSLDILKKEGRKSIHFFFLTWINFSRHNFLIYKHETTLFRSCMLVFSLWDHAFPPVVFLFATDQLFTFFVLIHQQQQGLIGATIVFFFKCLVHCHYDVETYSSFFFILAWNRFNRYFEDKITERENSKMSVPKSMPYIFFLTTHNSRKVTSIRCKGVWTRLGKYIVPGHDSNGIFTFPLSVVPSFGPWIIILVL